MILSSILLSSTQTHSQARDPRQAGVYQYLLFVSHNQTGGRDKSFIQTCPYQAREGKNINTPVSDCSHIWLI